MAREKLSTRDKAAAARGKENSKLRRESVTRWIGWGVVGVAAASIIGFAAFAANSGGSSTTAARGAVPSADPNAPVPAGVFPADGEVPFGVPLGDNLDAPLLEIWEDFQCPACKAFEEAFGAEVAALAEEGKARVVWRPTGFLDTNLGTTSSHDAINAWGCAIDSGVKREFHDIVYANQPTVEGEGWTRDTLISFGEQAGIPSDKTQSFADCVVSNKYMGWAANSTDLFYSSEVAGTPAVSLNGEEVDLASLKGPGSLREIVEAAAN